MALNRYVKENIVKLTSENANKNVEKKIRKDFSEKHNLKSDSRFSGKEVAEEVAKYIVRTQSIRCHETIHLFVNKNDITLSVCYI